MLMSMHHEVEACSKHSNNNNNNEAARQILQELSILTETSQCDVVVAWLRGDGHSFPLLSNIQLKSFL